MKNAVLIFPNSLFQDNHIINQYSTNSNIYIIEHPVYYTLYKYHKLKLILHRSTCKAYADYISAKYNITVKYVDYDKYAANIKKICKTHNKLIYYDPTDHIIENEFSKYSNEKIIYDSPLFLLTNDDILTYSKINGNKNYTHATFYKWMRNKFNILVSKSGQPVGNSWSFDDENRNSWPNTKLVGIYKFKYNNDKYVTEAINYTNKKFATNPGSTNFYLPTNHKTTKAYFKNFLTQRLSNFGPYQDAVDSDIQVGYHSLISPLLNIGLITPSDIVKMTLDHMSKNKTPIASVEGFIRQVIGWREFIRLMYVVNYNKMIQPNYFGHKTKLDKKVWYDWPAKSTGFEFIDDMIVKAHETAYLHHIERLMYIGNWFLLNRIKPSECYDWFMTFFIDAYNWVMTANVYAMSQYSSGRLMMTRPYFSSSSYISKMSNYKKNKLNTFIFDKTEYWWNEIWDALYWQFIADNRDKFKSNYSISSQVAFYNKKSMADKNSIKLLANKYFKYY